jgi:hypothetical protein
MVASELGPTAVQRAAEYLLAHLDELVEQITAHIWQAIPGYNDIMVDRLALEKQVRPNIVNALDLCAAGAISTMRTGPGSTTSAAAGRCRACRWPPWSSRSAPPSGS